MKLSHLSLAILSALALTACGGGGSSDHTKPDAGANKPVDNTPTPTPTPTPANPNDKVDPTDNGVVAKFQLDKHPSTGQSIYIRGKDSKFNLNAKNADKNSAATVFLGVSPDEQNQHLTNFVVAETNNNSINYFTGSRSQDFDNAESLQTENLKYRNDVATTPGTNRSPVQKETIQQLAGYSSLNDLYQAPGLSGVPDTVKKADYIKAATDVKPYIDAANKVVLAKKALDKAIASSGGYASLKTGGANESVLTAYNTAVNNLYNATKDKEDKLKKAFETLGVYASKVDKFAVKQKLKADNTGLEDEAATDAVSVGFNIDVASWDAYAKYWGLNIVSYDDATTRGGYTESQQETDSGLVTYRYDNTATDSKKILTIKGSESNNTGEKSDNVQTARIFGHFYLDPNEDNLTWTGETDAVNKTDKNVVLWSDSNNYSVLNSYSAPTIYHDETGKRQLGAIAQPLNYVQYGRVTAKVDPRNGNPIFDHFGRKMQRVNFDKRGNVGSTDFYFARGTNATSLAQMDALPKQGVINYQGHALLWGVDNNYRDVKGALPTAFGGGKDRVGLGNFVEAKFDLANRQVAGNVYNVYALYDTTDKEIGEALEKRNLVSFEGPVIGNSINGKATNLTIDEGVAGRNGDFRGNFFGSQANELGGSFNSTTAQDEYGNAKWGGVFGARRVETVEDVNVKWLGDKN